MVMNPYRALFRRWVEGFAFQWHGAGQETPPPRPCCKCRAQCQLTKFKPVLTLQPVVTPTQLLQTTPN